MKIRKYSLTIILTLKLLEGGEKRIHLLTDHHCFLNFLERARDLSVSGSAFISLFTRIISKQANNYRQRVTHCFSPICMLKITRRFVLFSQPPHTLGQWSQSGAASLPLDEPVRTVVLAALIRGSNHPCLIAGHKGFCFKKDLGRKRQISEKN